MVAIQKRELYIHYMSTLDKNLNRSGVPSRIESVNITTTQKKARRLIQLDSHNFEPEIGSEAVNASHPHSEEDLDNRPVSPHQRDTNNLNFLAQEQLKEIMSHQENQDEIELPQCYETIGKDLKHVKPTFLAEEGYSMSTSEIEFMNQKKLTYTMKVIEQIEDSFR